MYFQSNKIKINSCRNVFANVHVGKTFFKSKGFRGKKLNLYFRRNQFRSAEE
jgi:hypothetical protein